MARTGPAMLRALPAGEGGAVAIEGILRGVLTRAWDQLQTRGDAWADVKP